MSEEKKYSIKADKRKLLVLDTSYSLEDIRKRGILKSVTCRNLNGYFEYVWTIHPFATIVTSEEWAPRFGKPVWHSLDKSNTFVEGKIGRYKWLKWLSPLNFFIGQIGLYFTLKKLIREEGITIIRVGDMLYLGLFGWLLSKRCKVPFVVRVGGNHDKVYESTGQPMQKRLFFNRRIEKKVERFVLSRAHLVAGANQDNLNFAIASGARKEFTTIFRYGNLLDDKHFIEPESRQEGLSLLTPLNLKPKEFLIYIGRLEKVKHPDHVITVLASVKKKYPQLKALFVGGGTMEQEMRLLAKKLEIENDVVFAGNQNQDWLSRVIPLSAVVVSPHTGRALSEASLAGVCVAAYDIDWQGEIIENEVTGLLVPYPDKEKLATATERFLSDKEFSKRMAIALRNKAIDMLDPQKLDDHEIAEYESLLKRYYK